MMHNLSLQTIYLAENQCFIPIYFMKKKCNYNVYNCKYNNEDDESEEEYDDVVVCFRCGREGHYANSCYASKHIRGYYLK